MTIKFNKFNITNGVIKARVRYSYSDETIINGELTNKKSVTVYDKDYSRNLSKIFPDTVNDTDSMTDYFEKDRIRFVEGHKFYEEALKRVSL